MPSNAAITTNFLLLFVIALTPAHSQLTEPATVRIGVLSLFHPKTLILSSTRPLTLLLEDQTFILPPNQQLTLEATPDGLTLQTIDRPALSTGSLSTTEATFTLTVPEKLSRIYFGEVTVTAREGVLNAIVTMPTELAVASIVQAETPPHASLEALKAQAIVSRSFLLARRTAHSGANSAFDACDTTHCQFLRSPPPASSPASIATHDTRALVLTWRASPEAEPRIVPAMYSRSCGGHTRTHATSADAYPFYSVPCDFCLRHPELWKRAAPDDPPRTEQQRLAFNRTHGWSAVPSNSYIASQNRLAGRGTGHGIGLCQLGATDLALRGASYEKILAHFFPNTLISELK